MIMLKRLWSQEILRYLAVGVLNTLFGYCCFVLFVFLGLHYALASLLSTVLGVLFNFKSFGTLAFNSRDNRRFWRFVGVYVLSYLVGLLGLKLLTGLGLSAYAAGAAMLAPMAAITYVLHKRFVFHHA